tara:strand:- start:1725 stop:1928 length:204 start_codon:yes stop_codon:yes gene_type:complete
MSRYFTRTSRPKAYWEDEEPMERSGVTASEVHEQDFETWTGLLDHRGHEIHRCETIQIGFERPVRKS